MDGADAEAAYRFGSKANDKTYSFKGRFIELRDVLIVFNPGDSSRDISTCREMWRRCDLNTRPGTD